MKYISDPLQGRLFDPYQGLFNDKSSQRISLGWQSIFRALLLVLMPVAQLAKHFHEVWGRPTKELYSMAALLYLQELHNWTDAEAVDAYLYRTDLWFALNLEPGEAQLCERTLQRYRDLFIEEDLAAQVMNDVTQKLVLELNLKIDQQRLDSTHLFSNMATFGRTRMMAVTIKRFLTQVLRHHPKDHEALPEALRERYAPAVGKLFSVKGTNQEQRNKNRQQVAEDMCFLVDQFAGHKGLNDRPSYQSMVKIFHEQCEVSEGKITVKAKTGGNCMQNPSDPNATYDGKKGPGYKVQIAETCSEENEVQLIVSALVQTAVEHDAKSLEPVLEDLQKKEMLPTEMLADTAYGSDENSQKAADMGVELVSPVPENKWTKEEEKGPEAVEPTSAMAASNGESDAQAETEMAAELPAGESRGESTGEGTQPEEGPGTPQGEAQSSDKPMSNPLPKLSVIDFKTDEKTGKINACPSGRIPLQVIFNAGSETATVTMDGKDCESCPLRDRCPVVKTKGKKHPKYTVRFTGKQWRNEKRRREEKGERFQKKYGRRAGIESTNSGLKGKMGMGELRVRGSPQVRHAVYLKIAGWNLSRASASGLLGGKVTQILKALGLLGGWGLCFYRFWCVERLWGLGRALGWAKRSLAVN